MKINVDAINTSFEKLKKNVDAVGYKELEEGRYKKAWSKAKSEFRDLLKMYGYATFCNGVITCIDEDAIDDASQIVMLATLKSFQGKFELKQVSDLLDLLKNQFDSFLELRIKELEQLSEQLNAPIFVEKTQEE